MKITVSKTEIEALLRQKFNLASNDTIEIVESITNVKIQKAIELIEAIPYFSGVNKIRAIKAFREFFVEKVDDSTYAYQTTVGLADAKAIIENWDNFKLYVARYNKLPKDCYHNNLLVNFK